jgi:hypothetical protein
VRFKFFAAMTIMLKFFSVKSPCGLAEAGVNKEGEFPAAAGCMSRVYNSRKGVP